VGLVTINNPCILVMPTPSGFTLCQRGTLSWISFIGFLFLIVVSNQTLQQFLGHVLIIDPPLLLNPS
jgi:hypothetical protein